MKAAEIINIILVAVLVGVTAYYAWQTKRQLDMLKEQRTKSITPVLQVANINYVWNVSDGKDFKVLAPYLSLSLDSIGSAPALDLDIMATATVTFRSSKTKNPKYLRLNWVLHYESQEYYLEASSKITVNLILREAEQIEEDALLPEMMIRIDCQNLDYQRFRTTKEITMGDNLCEVNLGNYPDTIILPVDDIYLETINYRPRVY